MTTRQSKQLDFNTVCSASARRLPASLTFAALCFLALFAGCAEKPRASGKPVVVASFFPLYDFARQIAGDDLEVRCLVPPGGDPHAMEASPGVVKSLAGADVVLIFGLHMDGWVEKLVRSEKLRSVTVSEGIATRKAGRAALAEFSGETPDPDEADTHLWLDPLLAEKIATAILNELLRRAPAKRVGLQARGDALLADIRKLHDEFTAASARFQHREIVTFHGAFAYLFARYNLQTAGVIELFPGDEPSAAYLRALVDMMRQHRLKVIFAEPQLPDRPASVIAQEIGGRVERLDPCETILADAPQATYQERQRKNLATLKSTLGTITAP